MRSLIIVLLALSFSYPAQGGAWDRIQDWRKNRRTEKVIREYKKHGVKEVHRRTRAKEKRKLELAKGFGKWLKKGPFKATIIITGGVVAGIAIHKFFFAPKPPPKQQPTTNVIINNGENDE